MLSVQLSGYIPRSNKTLKNLTKRSTAKCPACLNNSPEGAGGGGGEEEVPVT